MTDTGQAPRLNASREQEAILRARAHRSCSGACPGKQIAGLLDDALADLAAARARAEAADHPEFTNAEFARFVQEAKEQRERAEQAEAERDEELRARESEQEATTRLAASHHEWVARAQHAEAAMASVTAERDVEIRRARIAERALAFARAVSERLVASNDHLFDLLGRLAVDVHDDICSCMPGQSCARCDWDTALEEADHILACTPAALAQRARALRDDEIERLETSLASERAVNERLRGDVDVLVEAFRRADKAGPGAGFVVPHWLGQEGASPPDWWQAEAKALWQALKVLVLDAGLMGTGSHGASATDT